MRLLIVPIAGFVILSAGLVTHRLVYSILPFNRAASQWKAAHARGDAKGMWVAYTEECHAHAAAFFVTAAELTALRCDGR